ncbi:MAG: alpha/beta-type small acid-soluble spore protein [Tissierellia bacterium]|nr:alpha/beta-type small acid-soluble spore protein [Tissierellia bacterium]
MANNNNKILVPEARQALEQLKLEIASELGVTNYNNIDKGELPSRVNGSIGGYMVKHLVETAQRQLSNR